MPPVLERTACFGEQSGRVLLSVLIPFYRDDPCALVAALAARGIADDTEFVLVSDGAATARELTPLFATVLRFNLRARVIAFGANRGRAAARHRLAEAAKGEFLLFLDADMRPIGDAFLARWRTLAMHGDVSVAFGGFRTPRSCARSQRLHRAVSRASDEHPARVRARHGALRLASSNLLVRRD
jgi:glycosyltransferase involved in cell wall biosynthesis